MNDKLTYEECLELRDAGFPQSLNGGDFLMGQIESDETGIITTNSVYAPSLSELIEACDLKCDQFSLFHWGSEWVCGDYSGYEQDWLSERCTGTTLEQAVKNLYCALNKKI